MISVIVPVYNVEPYLRKSVDSILAQTFRDIEVILIDDGSPDRCGEICEEYAGKDGRVRVIHTENRGLSAARNRGLEEAKGGYIGFVDSDDWIEPQMYELLLKRLLETGSDICVCDYTRDPVSPGSPDSVSHPVEGVYEGPDRMKALLRKKINIHVWNKLYRRELFRDKCFPEGRDYEDVVLMPQLLYAAERAAVIPFTGYHYRERTESITGGHSIKNLIDYADAHIDRYDVLNSCRESLHAKPAQLLYIPAVGIAAVWRKWHRCSPEEKSAYREKADELLRFTKEHIPLTGYRSWPRNLRLSSLFMHSGSRISFALLYYIKQFSGKRRKRSAPDGE